MHVGVVELIEKLDKSRERGYSAGYEQAINKFAEQMIIMMPGHRQDIEKIAEEMKKEKVNNREILYDNDYNK